MSESDFYEPEELDEYLELYGEINPKAIDYLRQNYNTDKAKQAAELMEKAVGETRALCDEIEQVYVAARNIVDNDYCSWSSYNLEEHGDIGWQVESLRDRLSDMEDYFQAARILLAPLERLIPIDEDMDIEGDMIEPYDENTEPRLSYAITFD